MSDTGMVVFDVLLFLFASAGIGAAYDSYKEKIGIWGTLYRNLAQLVAVLALICFIGTGLTASTIVGLFYSFALFMGGLFLIIVLGLLGWFGVLVNLILKRIQG